jgi:hypothetical protein
MGSIIPGTALSLSCVGRILGNDQGRILDGRTATSPASVRLASSDSEPFTGARCGWRSPFLLLQLRTSSYSVSATLRALGFSTAGLKTESSVWRRTQRPHSQVLVGRSLTLGLTTKCFSDVLEQAAPVRTFVFSGETLDRERSDWHRSQGASLATLVGRSLTLNPRPTGDRGLLRQPAVAPQFCLVREAPQVKASRS